MANILLAEDDASLRGFITATLERNGHSVTPCADGLEAMRALEDTSFDLLLTDIVMPGLDGIELSARARAKNPALKVMFITGFAAMVQKDIGEKTDGTSTRVISKPFHLGDLPRQIADLLGP